MNYKLRPGIALIKICDTSLLAASRSAWESCGRVRPVPKSWSILLSLMTGGNSSQDAIGKLASFLPISEEALSQRYGKALVQLAEEGYLIAEEEK